MAITALPTPPSRNDPTNFAVRADAFLGALPTFQTEANALQVDVNNKQGLAAGSAIAAANSAVAANNSQIAAAASAASASASANVTAWNPGTSYSVGTTVYDTTDYLTYRRKTAGTTATRPGLDLTNWQLIAGDTTLANAQTFTGIKTFTQTIVGSVSGNAATADALNDGTVLCPPGMVGYFARNTAPAGWLKANAAVVSRTTYAALFAAIGTTFGAGDGVNTFVLPELRGEFIRSWADNGGVDPGRGFGTFQADEFKSHTHTVVAAVDVNGRFTATGAGGAAGATVGTSAAGGAETRPRNIALLACIKF